MNAAYFVPLVGITLDGLGLARRRRGRVANHTGRKTAWTSSARWAPRPRSTPNRSRLPDRVQTPLVSRMFGPAARGLRHSLSRLYPSQDIDRVHADLLKAGLTGSVRAEEFVAIQVGSVMVGHAIGLIMLVSGVREREDRPCASCSFCPCSAAWPRATGSATASRPVASG